MKNHQLELVGKTHKEYHNNNVTVIPTAVGAIPKGLEKRLAKVETRGIIKAIQTTALLKSAKILIGNLKRLPVTQVSVKNHYLKLVLKNLLRVKIIVI